MKVICSSLSVLICLVLIQSVSAQNIAYIHGDVAPDGTIPSGSVQPFHKMRLDDTGKLGCSQFREIVESEGYTITPHYDRKTKLNDGFLKKFDVIIFGLHQKIWSQKEHKALDQWLRKGGGMLLYSDSAAGGHFKQVGLGNPVGQKAVNSIITAYGMEVAVDQGGGVRAYKPGTDAEHPIVDGQPVFEGEGVSPVAIDPKSDAVALIPFDDKHKVSGKSLTPGRDGISIAKPQWAALAHCPVGKGHMIVIFDRQPMWNNGPGSDINKRDNKEIMRRIVRYLAGEGV